MLRLSTISLLPKPIRLRVVKWVICNEEFLCYILVFSFSQASFLLKVRGKYSTVSISNIKNHLVLWSIVNWNDNLGVYELLAKGEKKILKIELYIFTTLVPIMEHNDFI